MKPLKGLGRPRTPSERRSGLRAQHMVTALPLDMDDVDAYDDIDDYFDLVPVEGDTEDFLNRPTALASVCILPEKCAPADCGETQGSEHIQISVDTPRRTCAATPRRRSVPHVAAPCHVGPERPPSDNPRGLSETKPLAAMGASKLLHDAQHLHDTWPDRYLRQSLRRSGSQTKAHEPMPASSPPPVSDLERSMEDSYSIRIENEEEERATCLGCFCFPATRALRKDCAREHALVEHGLVLKVRVRP